MCVRGHLKRIRTRLGFLFGRWAPRGARKTKISVKGQPETARKSTPDAALKPSATVRSRTALKKSQWWLSRMGAARASLALGCLQATVALYNPFERNNTDAYYYASALAGWDRRREVFAARAAAVEAALARGLAYSRRVGIVERRRQRSDVSKTVSISPRSVATWIHQRRRIAAAPRPRRGSIRGDGSRRGRGRDVDPSEETDRGAAAAATWIYRRARRYNEVGATYAPLYGESRGDDDAAAAFFPESTGVVEAVRRYGAAEWKSCFLAPGVAAMSFERTTPAVRRCKNQPRRSSSRRARAAQVRRADAETPPRAAPRGGRGRFRKRRLLPLRRVVGVPKAAGRNRRGTRNRRQARQANGRPQARRQRGAAGRVPRRASDSTVYRRPCGHPEARGRELRERRRGHRRRPRLPAPLESNPRQALRRGRAAARALFSQGRGGGYSVEGVAAAPRRWIFRRRGRGGAAAVDTGRFE